ncbi:hypothetical protein [Streptomyces sennicomposti]|nr:hypothetical protein [Streptomyces sennicomposti]MBY8867035.1 hypothetical protein [Streptomyces sennicomposti]
MTDNEFRTPMDTLPGGSVRTLSAHTSVSVDAEFLNIGGHSLSAVRRG